MGLYKDYADGHQLSDMNYENQDDIDRIDDSEHQKRIRRLLEKQLEKKRLKEEFEDELDGDFDWDELDK